MFARCFGFGLIISRDWDIYLHLLFITLLFMIRINHVGDSFNIFTIVVDPVINDNSGYSFPFLLCK